MVLLELTEQEAEWVNFAIAQAARLMDKPWQAERAAMLDDVSERLSTMLPEVVA